MTRFNSKLNICIQVTLKLQHLKTPLYYTLYYYYLIDKTKTLTTVEANWKIFVELDQKRKKRIVVRLFNFVIDVVRVTTS